jgi:hypothetical protein
MNVARHYQRLTTPERFALTVEALARLDISELDNLQSSMPEQCYTMTDAPYWRRLQMLQTLALRHSNWRKTRVAHTVYAALLVLAADDDANATPVIAAATQLWSGVLAQDEAWAVFCQSIDIDPPTVLRAFRVEPDELLDDTMTALFADADVPKPQVDPALRDKFVNLYVEMWGRAGSIG